MDDICANIAAIKARIDPTRTALVAVSKQQPESRIDAALAVGQRVFGENRVPEAVERWGKRRGLYTDLQLHLIGPLQTNKARDAVALFDVIHTIDRARLADVLKAEMDRQGRVLKCLVQVNTGNEAQKSGVRVPGLAALLDHCRVRELAISGLMCLPPQQDDPAPHFRILAALATQHGLPDLSMGMSGDYAVAAAMGATYIRVGAALFGAR